MADGVVKASTEPGDVCHDHLQALLDELTDTKDYESDFERKQHAIDVCTNHIPFLSIEDSIELADALVNVDNISYVRKERNVLYRMLHSKGNTRTYKLITGSLKDHIIDVMLHYTKESHSCFNDFYAKWQKVEPFMISTRGRLWSPLKYFYFGKTGKFFREVEKYFDQEEKQNHQRAETHPDDLSVSTAGQMKPTL